MGPALSPPWGPPRKFLGFRKETWAQALAPCGTSGTPKGISWGPCGPKEGTPWGTEKMGTERVFFSQARSLGCETKNFPYTHGAPLWRAPKAPGPLGKAPGNGTRPYQGPVFPGPQGPPFKEGRNLGPWPGRISPWPGPGPVQEPRVETRAGFPRNLIPLGIPGQKPCPPKAKPGPGKPINPCKGKPLARGPAIPSFPLGKSPRVFPARGTLTPRGPAPLGLCSRYRRPPDLLRGRDPRLGGA